MGGNKCKQTLADFVYSEKKPGYNTGGYGKTTYVEAKPNCVFSVMLQGTN